MKYTFFFLLIILKYNYIFKYEYLFQFKIFHKLVFGLKKKTFKYINKIPSVLFQHPGRMITFFTIYLKKKSHMQSFHSRNLNAKIFQKRKIPSFTA